MTRTSDEYDGTLDFNEAVSRKNADDRRHARLVSRRENRPISKGDCVESRIGPRRRSSLHRGTVRSVVASSETFGMRAVYVLWGDGSEQLCATADLRRVR